MAEGYAKLLSSILDSSIWAEPDDAIRLWVTLLAMADKNGCVWASVGGIANRSRTISIERTRELLRKFQQPDEDSRSKDLEGRRLVEIDRGFLIVNYANIRNMHADGNERARKRAWWEANRGVASKANQQHSDSLDASGASATLGYGSVSASAYGFGSEEVEKTDERAPTLCPDSISPSARAIEVASECNRDWSEDFAEMREWSRDNNKRKSDWNRALINWMRRNKGKPRKGAPCPDRIDFTESHRSKAKRISLDIENAWVEFRSYSRSIDKKCTDWSEAFLADLARKVAAVERQDAIRRTERGAAPPNRPSERVSSGGKASGPTNPKDAPQANPGAMAAIRANLGGLLTDD